MQPKVIVLLLNFNQCQLTIDCVKSLLLSEYSNYEVFVVDNGSMSFEYECLTKNLKNMPNIRILRIDNNCGYAGGINFGLESTIGFNPDFYLIMNNDTIIDKSAIKMLVDASDRYGNKCIVTGKVYEFDRPNIIQYVGGKYIDKRYLTNIGIGVGKKDIGQFDVECERDMIDDIFWLLPASLYKQIGGYNRAFFLYAEQDDFALKAVASGYKLIFTPQAKIWHKGSATVDSTINNPAKTYWMTKSLLIFWFLNLKRKYFCISFSKYISNIVFNDFIKDSFFAIKNKRKKNYRITIAKISAVWHFMRWLMNRKNDAGYNPFIKK